MFAFCTYQIPQPECNAIEGLLTQYQWHVKLQFWHNTVTIHKQNPRNIQYRVV